LSSFLKSAGNVVENRSHFLESGSAILESRSVFPKSEGIFLGNGGPSSAKKKP